MQLRCLHVMGTCRLPIGISEVLIRTRYLLYHPEHSHAKIRLRQASRAKQHRMNKITMRGSNTDRASL